MAALLTMRLRHCVAGIIMQWNILEAGGSTPVSFMPVAPGLLQSLNSVFSLLTTATDMIDARAAKTGFWSKELTQAKSSLLNVHAAALCAADLLHATQVSCFGGLPVKKPVQLQISSAELGLLQRVIAGELTSQNGSTPVLNRGTSQIRQVTSHKQAMEALEAGAETLLSIQAMLAHLPTPICAATDTRPLVRSLGRLGSTMDGCDEAVAAVDVLNGRIGLMK